MDETGEQKEQLSFPPEHIEPLRGLLFLGAMKEIFEFAGHEFELKTLNEADILRIGELIRPYMDSPVDMEAQKIYTLAAALCSVDGELISEPYKEGYDPIAENAKTIKQWYPETIDFMYMKYLELEKGAREVAKSLKK